MQGKIVLNFVSFVNVALIKRGVNNQSDMLLEPESRATLMGGQEGLLHFHNVLGSEIGWEFCQ